MRINIRNDCALLHGLEYCNTAELMLLTRRSLTVLQLLTL